MTPDTRLERATAILIVALVLLTALVEWGVPALAPTRAVVTVATILLLTVQVRASRKAFVAVGAALTIWTVAVNPGWPPVLMSGLGAAAFIGGYFTALTTLRNVAAISPAIVSASRYLTTQPPGRRYAALTLGGHVFGLLLSYGAISLLSSLVTGSNKSEPNAEIRKIRTRRMLLAIQRGFVATLPWSPLSFAMAITTVLIPGATWTKAVLPGIVSALIITGIGWALDTVLKPRLAVRPVPRPVEGTIRRLNPLFLLLLLLAGCTAILHEVTGIRIVGVVIVVVPLVSFGWALIQHRGGAHDFTLADHARHYLFTELPGYRGELTLLMMAGYIGTLGAPLLAPFIQKTGLDLAALPPWLLLVCLVWITPILGQVGMNPILAVGLYAPLLPCAASMGINPNAIVTAIAAGWAMSGISSPYTATTLLVSNAGGVSALHVGLRWNGLYLLVVGPALTLWTLTYAFVLG